MFFSQQADAKNLLLSLDNIIFFSHFFTCSLRKTNAKELITNNIFNLESFGNLIFLEMKKNIASYFNLEKHFQINKKKTVWIQINTFTVDFIFWNYRKNLTHIHNMHVYCITVRQIIVCLRPLHFKEHFFGIFLSFSHGNKYLYVYRFFCFLIGSSLWFP